MHPMFLCGRTVVAFPPPGSLLWRMHTLPTEVSSSIGLWFLDESYVVSRKRA